MNDICDGIKLPTSPN